MYIFVYVQACLGETGSGKDYKIGKRLEAVKNCRQLTKSDMVLNNYLPTITGLAVTPINTYSEYHYSIHVRSIGFSSKSTFFRNFQSSAYRVKVVVMLGDASPVRRCNYTIVFENVLVLTFDLFS